MHTFTDASAATARHSPTLCLERLAMQAPLDDCLTPERLTELAGGNVTDKGIGSGEAVRLWAEVLAPACLSVDHPRYLSFIPGRPSKAAAAFDMLVGASSVYGGSWLEGSGAVYAENQALRWVAELAGMPNQAGGVFVQGGTIGNLSALVAARETARHKHGNPPGRWAVVITDETHSSVKHALEVVMDVDVIKVPGDERGRLTGAGIRARLTELSDDQRAGIFAVVATVGTTNTGHHRRRGRHRRRCPGERLVAARRWRLRRRGAGRAVGARAVRRASSAPTRSSSTRTSGCSRPMTAAR